MEETQGFSDLRENNGNAVHPMAGLLEDSFEYRELHHGDIVEGTIVHVSPSEVLIDIGSKSEGVLAGREMERMSPEARDEIQVGQKVLVYVLNPEDKSGNVILSLSHAQLERDWREAEKKFQAGDVFPATVSSFNKGGLIVHIGKVRGFVPASQLITMPRDMDSDEGRTEELSKLVGREFQLKIIEVDRKRNRLILSQRAAVRETRQEQREKLLVSLTEGSRVRGKVSNLCDFGAFVNLGGADGLIHISELSWGRVTHPSEILSVGDEVEVYVLNVEPERQRIGLSLKRLQAEPWTQVEDKYAIDQVVTGKVTKLTSFGAFVRIEDEIEGLIHISELAERHVNHPKEILKEGEEVDVRIIRIDPERKRIGLSLKGTEEEPEVDWQVAEDDGQLDEVDWEEEAYSAESAADQVDTGSEDLEGLVGEVEPAVEETALASDVTEHAVSGEAVPDQVETAGDDVEGAAGEVEPAEDEAILAGHVSEHAVSEEAVAEVQEVNDVVESEA